MDYHHEMEKFAIKIY